MNSNAATYPTCPICLCDIIPSDDAKIRCSHPIHLECAQSMHDTRCPVCRDELKSELLTSDVMVTIKERRAKYVAECRNSFTSSDRSHPPRASGYRWHWYFYRPQTRWSSVPQFPERHSEPVARPSEREATSIYDLPPQPTRSLSALQTPRSFRSSVAPRVEFVGGRHSLVDHGVSRDLSRYVIFSPGARVPNSMRIPTRHSEVLNEIEYGFEVTNTVIGVLPIIVEDPLGGEDNPAPISAASYDVRWWIKILRTGATKEKPLTTCAIQSDLDLIRRVLVRPGSIRDLVHLYVLSDYLAEVQLYTAARMLYNDYILPLLEFLYESVRSSPETSALFAIGTATPNKAKIVTSYGYVDSEEGRKETKHQKKREQKRREKKSLFPTGKLNLKYTTRNPHVRGATGRFRKTRRQIMDQ